MPTSTETTMFDPDPTAPEQVERFEDLCTNRSPEHQPKPVRPRTQEEQRALERKLDWFYWARYGVMAHFLPNMGRFNDPEKRIPWDSASWNEWVDAIEVEKIAAQAEELEAGYVVLPIGQQGNYYCAPNPVYEKHWGFAPQEYGTRRDLPADLEKALRKRGVRLMIYITGAPTATEGPAREASARVGWQKLDGRPPWRCTEEGSAKWAEVVQWWVTHYKGLCAGYWIDGVNNYCRGHAVRFMDAVRSADPDALFSCWWNALSDYNHGHCTYDWEEQQQRLPPNGRWLPEFDIQYHVFQYLGHRWGGRTVEHSTASMTDYARKVIEGGGVFTFDVGVFDESTVPHRGPFLEIPEGQMEQLRAVRDKVRDIER
jgi:hypothetical protein